MTRSNAREVAVHMIYELGFGSRSAEELLEHEMTRERFAQLGEEEPLYAQFPNEKQRQYIRDLVQGVYVHGPEQLREVERLSTYNYRARLAGGEIVLAVVRGDGSLALIEPEMDG